MKPVLTDEQDKFWGILSVRSPSCDNCKYIQKMKDGMVCNHPLYDESKADIWHRCAYTKSLYKTVSTGNWWEWDGKNE